MTVAELIERLREQDPDAQVFYESNGPKDYLVSDVEQIKEGVLIS